MDTQQFDLIVIGTGSGGSVTAGKYAKVGLNVAQIDALPFGGTCTLRVLFLSLALLLSGYNKY